MNESVAGTHPAEAPLVLVVDDEPDLLELVSLTLSRMSLKTRTASDLASAQHAAEKRALRSVPHRHAPARWRRP